MVSRYRRACAFTLALGGRESRTKMKLSKVCDLASHPLHSHVVSGKRVALSSSVGRLTSYNSGLDLLPLSSVGEYSLCKCESVVEFSYEESTTYGLH